MELKLDAYLHAFEGQGFAPAAVKKVQLETAGLSRQRVIRLIYRSLGGAEMPEALYEEALQRFTARDEENRLRMRFIPGALEFLQTESRRRPLALITGTPQEVIDKTVEVFGLAPYFRRICGTPKTKPEHLRELLREWGLKAEETLFVGDSVQDQNGAREAGVPFVGIDPGDHPFREEPLLFTLPSLGELSGYLGGATAAPPADSGSTTSG